MNKDDRFWKQAAEKYLSEYSADLRRELESLEGQEARPTPVADARVQLYVQNARQKSRKKGRLLLAAVACVILLVCGPIFWSVAPDLFAPSYEVLPLSFSLPGRFAVDAVEQDQEKTVYSLSDRQSDPVVMTLEKEGDTSFFDTLTPVIVDGEPAYAREGDGCNLLAFERGGILYVLTCRYDLNTLADLSRAIPV